MSSSCVQAKEPRVMHDPNPDSNDHDHTGNDTDSECGSLCTCTSSSMTSIATSVATCNHANGRVSRLGGSSVSLSQPQQQQQQQSATASAVPTSGATHQTGDGNGNPYIVVFVPPTMLPHSSNCGNCRGQGTLQTAVRAYLVTACEFCPWVAGFVFIYYAFYWWGIGPGFSAFLFMMGSHALIRFIRARGEAGGCCGVSRLSRVPQNSPSNETEENEEEEEDDGDGGNDEDDPHRDAPQVTVNEGPPSYEVAVVKPPPYDLYHHLTPTQPRSQIQQTSKQNLNENFLSVPEFSVKKTPSEVDDDDDIFLPSYQDAIRLSFRSEKNLDDPTEDNEES